MPHGGGSDSVDIWSQSWSTFVISTEKIFNTAIRLGQRLVSVKKSLVCWDYSSETALNRPTKKCIPNYSVTNKQSWYRRSGHKTTMRLWHLVWRWSDTIESSIDRWFKYSAEKIRSLLKIAKISHNQKRMVFTKFLVRVLCEKPLNKLKWTPSCITWVNDCKTEWVNNIPWTNV